MEHHHGGHKREKARTPVAWQQRDGHRGGPAKTHQRVASEGKRSGSRTPTWSRNIGSSSPEDETVDESTTETESQTMTATNDEGMKYSSLAVPLDYGYGHGPPSVLSPMSTTGAPAGPFLLAPAPPSTLPPNGSIRSVHSVPVLAAPTWDGEPCPVHHSAIPFAALYGMGPMGPGVAPVPSLPPTAYSVGPASVPPSVISTATTVRRARSIAELSNMGYATPGMPGTPKLTRSRHGSLHHVNGVGHMAFLNPRMVLNENGSPAALPTREFHPAEKKYESDVKDDKENNYICCSRHLLVLWIILGIITFGILLAILLKFTIA